MSECGGHTHVGACSGGVGGEGADALCQVEVVRSRDLGIRAEGLRIRRGLRGVAPRYEEFVGA